MTTRSFISTKRPKGTALVVVFLVLSLLMSMIIALLQMTVANASLVDNTRDRYQALLLAQSGISHAIAELNANRTLGSGASHTVGSPTMQWGIQKNYTVSTVRNADGTLTITSIGTYQYAQYGTSDQYHYSSTGNSSIIVFDPQVHRKLVAIVTFPQTAGVFSAGAFGKSGVTLTGVAQTDSFSSALGTTYAAQVAAAGGKDIYDATVGAGGNVGSNMNINGVGNIIVHGNATPGPGMAVSLTGGATVTGSTTAAAALYDTPSYIYSPPSGLTAMSYSGNNTVTIAAGNYRFASDFKQTGGTVTFAAGITNIYLDSGLKQSGQGLIVLAAGATVNIYQDKDGSFDMAGQGLTNNTQIASSFNVVSASIGTVNVTGQGNIYATVYAPDASAKVAGNGEFFGAVIADTVTLSGLGEFHYDTAATSPGIKTTVTLVASWEVDM
ncbi:MAG: hypothetical protein WCT04_09940 [Planctomycetota bacterium]